jgi:uncharacterized peroxidase-related enzyme
MDALYKMNLAPQTRTTATGRSKEVLDKAQQQVGFIPNMYANMVNSPGLLDTYLYGYNLFRSESGFSAPEQEVVFLSASVENGCTYCVAAHSALADMMSKVPPEVTEAIRDGTPVPDPKLRALSEFTRLMVATRGWPGAAAVDAFLSAGYTERHILEIILAIAVKTLSNYSNHIFQTPVDDMFAGRRWQDPRR